MVGVVAIFAQQNVGTGMAPNRIVSWPGIDDVVSITAVNAIIREAHQKANSFGNCR